MHIKNRAVFLDRDGTLMEDVDYCSDPEKVRIFPGVNEALLRLRDAGFHRIVITNQSGIGRGLMTHEQYVAVETKLLDLVGEGLIDATYFCADMPGQNSARRKPRPGMVIEAARDWNIDLARSFFIGDKTSDIDCGR
ncbi:MAG: HAD family hydrolase, partial [Verrucomicrobiota bacterium]|nr:HAD family hydrolase [Verrucomicrobiota bacterium]